MYRLAVSNVLAHDRDDHSKNFSFIMDETGKWCLSPTYDLMFSSGPEGEQSTVMMGEGRNPRIAYLKKLEQEAKPPDSTIDDIFGKTKTALALLDKACGSARSHA